MTVRVGCIVEGHGETSALPVLLRRIAASIDTSVELQIPNPIRIQRSKLQTPGELEKAIQLAARKVAPDGRILIVMDADDDCPATLAPVIAERARAVRTDLPIAVVFPNREFESWFLAAAESLRDRFGKHDLQAPADAEAVRGAKEWLRERLPGGKYSPTVDQPSLAATFDLQQARRAPSFDKLWREMERLLRTRGDFAGDNERP